MAEQTEISRGVTYYAELTATNAAGEADGLTGFSFRATVRRPGGSVVATLDDSISLKSGTENVVVVEISAEDTWDLPEGSFSWDILTDRPSAAGVDIIVPTEPFIVTTPQTRPE